jgi:ketosteroid isomerase-like protein
MAHTVTRQVVDAFYDAYTTGDRDKLAAILHDDIEWLISGPVAVLLYCGERHGKAQVLELACNILPGVLADLKVWHESVVISGDSVATLNRLTARRRSDGRQIGYRFAHFIRFQDGKVIETLSVIDTFDAAEQMLGHSLAVHDDGVPHAKNLVLL